MKTKVINPFNPVYNKNSKVLILGTMPSPKAREIGFYYAHPQNRFWKIMYDIFDEEYKEDTESRIDFLNKHSIALWDTLYSCEINGAEDSSIDNVRPNDINKILKETKIKKIFTTGKTAYKLYNKYIFNKTKLEAISLPSTSPANCRIKYEDIKKDYLIIKDSIK